MRDVAIKVGDIVTVPHERFQGGARVKFDRCAIVRRVNKWSLTVEYPDEKGRFHEVESYKKSTQRP